MATFLSIFPAEKLAVKEKEEIKLGASQNRNAMLLSGKYKHELLAITCQNSLREDEVKIMKSVSPPVRKQVPEKSQKSEDPIPRLILAPFSPQAEVKFGEVLVNSVQWKPLLIFNPSVSIAIQFTNINPDDRISISDCKVQLNSLEEKQLLISWSPLQSGYLRKVIRAQDSVRKAKSFDVILSGMAVNKVVQNLKKKKTKSETNITQTSQKCSNATATMTVNQKLPDFRRETFSIDEKENRLPMPPNFKKTKPSVAKSFSPCSDYQYQNVLNENSIMTNFSRYCSSYDTVDAPVKYSSFEYEINGSRHNSSNTNLTGEMNPRRSTFSADHQSSIFSPPKCSFNDSSEKERASTPTRNMYAMNDVDVSMTPLKDRGECFLFSPPDNLPITTSSMNIIHTKSMSCLSSIDGSFVSHFSFKQSFKDEVLYISPPAKTIKPNRKSNDFIHRTESSAIKDRRKHMRTSFMCKKKLSPKKLSCNGRSTTINTSAVEKIRSQNPQALKQVVASQGNIEDPFVQQLLYSDDEWVDEQEKNIIKWMNSILVPTELSEDQADRTVDGAEAWIKRNNSGNSISLSNKVPIILYNAPENLNILRKRKDTLLESDYVKVVFNELSAQVSKKVIFVREGRDIYADEGIKNKLLSLLGCYNPVWLRIGLEAVYKQEIPLQSKADFGGLGLFIRKKVIVASSFVKKTEREKEATRKAILLRFLQLIFFMDQARIQKLIRHKPCLFNLNSKHKSSQTLLDDFCADLVTGRGYVMKQLKNTGFILQFKQTCIDEYDYTIKNLKDLNDGVRLTRLFEILFSEPNLCGKLRVPAVDIENKKYNIEVAMRAAKIRCTIKGNINAEDFVLVTRLGSRLKILSFLWQIIYNYLAPLYEKAAIKIQEWWRIQLMRVKTTRLQDMQNKDRSARIIQNVWRKHCLRKNLNKLVLQLRGQRQNEEKSARIIQTRFRAFLVMKRDRETYLRKLEAVKIIQRCVLLRKQRKNFVDMKNAVLVIQRWYRGCKITSACRTYFLNLRRSTITIQRQFRARREAIVQRTEFLKLKNVCVKIQRRFRGRMVMKKERQSFTRLKQNTILIQRSYRRYRIAKNERENYLKLKNAAIVTQRRFQAKKLMRLERHKYIMTKQAAVKIQRHFRNYKLTCQLKKEFVTLKKFTIFVQRTYRANLIMKQCRNRFLQVKASTLTIQRWYRNCKRAKIIRLEYVRLKAIVIKIQRQFRAKHLMKYERQQYMRLTWAAVEIQRRFRAKKSMKAERERFLALKWAVLRIQKQFRTNRMFVSERNEFLRLRNSAVIIQRRYRAILMIRNERRKFLALKTSAIIIQQMYRATISMRKEREEYVKIRSLTIKMQQSFRARRLMRVERERFLRLKMAAATLQQKYRAQKSMEQLREPYLHLKKSALILQRQWRMKMARNRYLRVREATIKIQRWWLRIKAEVPQRAQQILPEITVPVNTAEDVAAMRIQALWRGYRIRKMALIPKRKSIDSKSALPQRTLGERYRTAIEQIQTSDLYNVIFKALWNLERVTTFSAKLCEGVAAEGIVPIIFDLMSRGNRSEPSLELYRSSISILINLTLHPPTKSVLWDNFNKVEYIDQILRLMKMTYDKFFKKNDSDVFRYCTTFLWLLCQDEEISECIANLPFVQFHLKKMKDSLDQKCPCRKTNKGKPVLKMLPKTETNWYADAKTRTFDDNCIAIDNLYNILYHK